MSSVECCWNGTCDIAVGDAASSYSSSDDDDGNDDDGGGGDDDDGGGDDDDDDDDGGDDDDDDGGDDDGGGGDDDDGGDGDDDGDSDIDIDAVLRENGMSVDINSDDDAEVISFKNEIRAAARKRIMRRARGNRKKELRRLKKKRMKKKNKPKKKRGETLDQKVKIPRNKHEQQPLPDTADDIVFPTHRCKYKCWKNWTRDEAWQVRKVI